MARTKGSYSVADEAERLKLYRSGLVDWQIAKKLGYATITITHWRRSRGLIANGGIGHGGKRIRPVR